MSALKIFMLNMQVFIINKVNVACSDNINLHFIYHIFDKCIVVTPKK